MFVAGVHPRALTAHQFRGLRLWLRSRGQQTWMFFVSVPPAGRRPSPFDPRLWCMVRLAVTAGWWQRV